MQGIEADLLRWGAWARERLPGKIKALLIYRQGEALRQSWIPPMGDDEAALFDPAVATLRDVAPELYEVVRLHYIYGLSFYAIAKAKQCNSKDVLTKGRKAEAFIAGFVCGAALTSARDKKALA